MNSIFEALEQFAYNLYAVGVIPGRIELTLPKKALEQLDYEFAVKQRHGSSEPAQLEQYWAYCGFLFRFKRESYE